MANFFATCRGAGVKLTQPRIEIFRAVAESARHPNATAVYESLKPRMPSLSLDTVYRTLWLLKDLGLINTVGTPRESTRFDANLHHHHHFVCDQCGLTQDFESSLYDHPPEVVAQFGQAQETRVEVHGTCRSCM